MYPDKSVSTAMDLFRQPRHGLSGNKWRLFALTQADHIAEAGCNDRWLRRGAVGHLQGILGCNSAVERSAVNRFVAGSIPAAPAKCGTNEYLGQDRRTRL